MINSLCGSMGSLKGGCSDITSSSPPLSPTASVSESNHVPASPLLHGIKFDTDAEVQSPDGSIWESLLFSDQLDAGADFMMISSPRRDYMIISSPKREYVISSPKRSSGALNYSIGYGHSYGYSSPAPCNVSHKGKSPSPLHRLHSDSASHQHQEVIHGESQSLALPAMDSLLDDCTLVYPPVRPCSSMEGALEAVALPSLLDCLSMPEPRGEAVTLAAGLQMAGEVELYQVNDHLSTIRLQSQQEEQGEMDGLVGGVGEQAEAAYQSLLGAMLSEQPEQEQESGLQLVHLLLACAEAVAKDDYLAARRYLHHLCRVVSPLGDSMQRVAACFADALAARLTASPSAASIPSPDHPDTLRLYQVVYQACPYVKFAHFTANQAIFEAFDGEDRVHVIDLDILQGYQWPALIHALAARPAGPPSLRITGVGSSLDSVRDTGRRLADLARSLRVPFTFHAVAGPPESLRPHALHRRVGEALAVNAVNRLHRVPAAALGGLLAMLRDQAPAVVTVVEQEAAHGGAPFLARFLEALHYYSAIFDSLDATFPAESAARARVEQQLFAAEIRNIVACEGVERVERHERLERWRRVMEGRGFEAVPLSSNAASQSRVLLGLYACDGYRLTEDNGCLLLGWQDRPILAASAWRC